MVDAISLSQFAVVSTIVVGLKVLVPRVYKEIRAKRRLSQYLAMISNEGARARCDDRGLKLLDYQLGLLFSSGYGLCNVEDIYLKNKNGDLSLELIQLFARALAKLPQEDRRVIEQTLRGATEDRRVAYLREAFGPVMSGR